METQGLPLLVLSNKKENRNQSHVIITLNFFTKLTAWRLTNWLNDLLNDWPTDLMTNWLIGRLTEWLTGWQTDWLNVILALRTQMRDQRIKSVCSVC